MNRFHEQKFRQESLADVLGDAESATVFGVVEEEVYVGGCRM